MDTRNNNRYSSGLAKGGSGGYSGGSYNHSTPISADPPVKFFLDTEKEKLNYKLFDEIAEEKADKIIQAKQLSSAQLRRFFGEMKGYYQQWKNQEKSDEAFEKIFPLIKLMKSKVYYAQKPPKAKIPREFASFLLGGIKQISDGKDFEAFIFYFEAIVGFLYGKGLR